MYFTRQRFARSIIDAENIRSLFVNISRHFGISVALRAYSFHKCITDERNLSPVTITLVHNIR